MTLATLQEFAAQQWKNALEILILAVGIYYAYLGLKGTRGLRVLTGLAAVVLTLALLSQLFGLEVISWLLRSLSAVVLLALVVIFQPELRRMLANLGSHRIFGTQRHNLEIVDLISQTAFDLSNRHLGALIAIERGTDIQSHIESGVMIDSRLSPELTVSIFHPKTPLHDGGLVVRNDRIISAGCIFPVSQRQDLDRNLGLRHRAAIGLTEESDAVVIVVSEETRKISICHAGKVEQEFTPETLRKRLSELLLKPANELPVPQKTSGETLLTPNHEKPVHQEPGGEGRVAGAGGAAVGRHQEEPAQRTDNIAA
jgi:diadenylate cyclase